MIAAAPRSVDATAVYGRRLAAYFIDALIGALLALAVLVPMFMSRADKVDTRGRSGYCDTYNSRLVFRCFPTSDTTAYLVSSEDMNALSGAFYGSSLAWIALNAVLVQGITGGSIGKLVLGLRVVRHDGSPAGLGKCAVRSLILPIDAILCGVIGLATSLTTAGHRRLGDMAAATLVVDRRSEGHPLVVPGLAGLAPVTAYPPVTPRADGPTWDPNRDAYIQYDRSRSEWVQWDDTAKSWRPIDT